MKFFNQIEFIIIEFIFLQLIFLKTLNKKKKRSIFEKM